MAWYTLRRQAARIVVLDRDRRVFLMSASDPSDRAKPPWWEIPGGGIDPPESSAEAAARELYEEAGLTAEIGPCVWTQYNEFDFAGIHFEQDEFIHVAWCDGGEYHPTHLEFLEAQAFSGAKWWPLDELLASDVPTLPPRLREFLPALVAGDLPDEPIDVGVLPPRR